MILGELHGPFPWGLLLITDEGSTEHIPKWTTDADQLTTSTSSAVLRIRHEVDGPAVIRVWDVEPTAAGPIVDECVLLISSGILRVSDALGDQAVRVPVPVGSVMIKLMRSEPVHASQVDVVVDTKARAAS